MPKWTNVSGCTVERNVAYLAKRREGDAPFSRLTFYNGQNGATPWASHDLPWSVVSVCLWRDGPIAPRVCVALSDRGDVELTGQNGEPRFAERILAPDSSTTTNRVRQIGAYLHACGTEFRTFRRGPTAWEEFTRPDDEHLVQGLDRLKEYGDSLTVNDILALGVTRSYLDINGHAKDNLFAVGPSGPGTSRIAHHNGVQWTVLDDALPGTLTCIEPSARGGAYLGGWDGLLLYGDHRQGFIWLPAALDNGNIGGLREFQGRLYIASDRGFFVFDHDRNQADYVRTGILPVPQAFTRLDSMDGVLWAFAYQDLAWFDSTAWHRLEDPDNPLGRR